jgi:hypothetical protein
VIENDNGAISYSSVDRTENAGVGGLSPPLGNTISVISGKPIDIPLVSLRTRWEGGPKRHGISIRSVGSGIS